MLFAILVALAQQGPVAGATTATIPRLEASATIDGRLDEPVWLQAARLSGFHQYEPVDSRPAEEQTEVLIWYAPDAIHFGIRAHDRAAGTIRATRADRDNIAGEDHVIIYLDTFLDRRRAFFFGVNALGVQADGVRTEGSPSAGRMFGSSIDFNPDFIFESKGAVTEDGYVVEVRVPFKSLRYPTNGPQKWGLQIERKVQRTGYTDTWTDVRRANASYLVQAGVLDGLRELERGVVLEAQPFLTASADGTRENNTFERASPRGDVGANLKVSFTNLALDGTVNPDFSQIESDAGQVTLNERFALFIPEKRPFFLEGIELFNTPNQLVYTRQVVNPIGGTKVTGKLGSISMAHLTALDEDVPATCYGSCPKVGVLPSNALFNVTRLRHDFGSNSGAGLLLTDRSVLDTDEYNRVVAADTRVVFGKLYYAEVQAGHSWSRDWAGNTRTGPLWKADLDRTGRRWGFHYGLNALDDDFDTRAGFVPRVGMVQLRAANRLSFYGKPGALVEQVTTFFSPLWYWRYEDFPSTSPMEGTETAQTTLRMRGGWNSGITLGRMFFEFDQANFAGYQVDGQPYRALDRVTGPTIEWTLTTPTFRRFDANVKVTRARAALFAEGSSGTNLSVTGGVSMRPTRSVRVGWTGGLQQLERTRDDTEFARTLLARLKAEYQPSRALFFRAIGDYRYERQAALEDAVTGKPLLSGGSPLAGSNRRNLRVDFLVSYEPTPGTVAFLGYGAGLVDPSVSEPLQRMSDGFFVKLAYQFRR